MPKTQPTYMRVFSSIAVLLIAGEAYAGTLEQQGPLTNALAKREYAREKMRLSATAERMPPEHYAFRIDANSKTFAANLVAVAALSARV